MKHYKFLNLKGKKIVSNSGNCSWKVGEWKKEEKIDICNCGFHCSDTILDALSYVQGDVLAIVKTRGKSEKQKDKSVWQEMILDEVYYWTKKDSVALSIFSAELVIKNYEKECPNDSRPRDAIEAAKKWLKNPTEKNKSAAWSAESAESAAESAESAAWSAAWSAKSAAWSAAWSAKSAAWSAKSAAKSAAWSAAKSAAWSAKSAAWSAESAAWSAAKSAAKSAAWSAESAAWSAKSAAWSAEKINKKINYWLVKRIKKLKKYES